MPFTVTINYEPYQYKLCYKIKYTNYSIKQIFLIVLLACILMTSCSTSPKIVTGADYLAFLMNRPEYIEKHCQENADAIPYNILTKLYIMSIFILYFKTIGWLLIAFMIFTLFVVGWKRTDGKWSNPARLKNSFLCYIFSTMAGLSLLRDAKYCASAIA